VIALTHAVFAWLLAVVFQLNPIITILAALVPDAEYILGTVHRGPLHSLLIMVPLAALTYFYDREKGEAVSAGVFSHLFLDSLTKMGVPLFYPLINKYYSLYFYDTNNLNWIVIAFSLAVLFNAKKLFEKEVSKKVMLIIGICWFLVLLILGSSSAMFAHCPETLTQLNSLVPGEYFTVQGIICSEVKNYTSQSGNNYQDFQICADNDSVRIFKLHAVETSELAYGDSVKLCGEYTSDYGGEINYVQWISKI
jgi:inner membrane protein